jgi:CubicO group peptidase (beta-lactamase class C family)
VRRIAPPFRSSFLVFCGTLVSLGCAAPEPEVGPGRPATEIEVEIPRTRTLPGLEEAPYPYVAPAEVGLSAERLDRLSDRVAGWVRDSLIVGAEILIVKDRRIALHEAVGWSDRDAGEPMRRNTIFRLRSMTKPFTGTAALMLAEEGKLDVDGPVSRWLPSWNNERSGEITVRHLLTHTGGWVQGGLPEPLGTYPRLRAAVDAAGEAGPQHPPGEAFRYSDVHSYALGALVEEVSGMPVERFLEERILDPLGLDDTHTRFAPDTAWAGRMNPTYQLEDGAWVQYWHPDSTQVAPFFRASGGLYSTVFDYARWLDAWMQWAGLLDLPTAEASAPRLLSESMARQAVTPSALGAYGYHWGIHSLDPLVFGHGGSDGTVAAAMPARNVIALYFTQSRGTRTRGEWNDAVWDAVAPDLEIARPTPSLPAVEADLDHVEIPTGELERYQGAYTLLGDTVTFSLKGGRLRARELSGPRVTLDGRPIEGFTLVPLGDRTFAFGRYEAGELLEVYLPGQRLRFKVEEGHVVGFWPVEGSREGPFAPRIH